VRLSELNVYQLGPRNLIAHEIDVTPFQPLVATAKAEIFGRLLREVDILSALARSQQSSRYHQELTGGVAPAPISMLTLLAPHNS
jgi:hypothetical protein